MIPLADSNGLFKVRVLKEADGGACLSPLKVFNGTVPIQEPDWMSILLNRSGYTFAPHFVDDEQRAFSFPRREIAEIQRRILFEQGIATQLVSPNGSLEWVI